MAIIDITLHAAFAGDLWQGCEGRSGVQSFDLSSYRRRICDSTNPNYRATLNDVIDSILAGHGGDFVNAKLCANAVIVVTCRKLMGRGSYTRTRIWDITSFPSIAEFVDIDAWSNDFEDVDAGEEG